MQPLAALRRSERGAVIVMVAVWLPVLAIFAAFAIDVAHFYDYSRNLQNRADAAAFAGGDQMGNACASNPTDPRTSPELPIGQMAQLFSGPPGSSSDLPYPYNGAGSPLAAFPSIGAYQNVPNLNVRNGGNGANYHVLLNADNYAHAGGTNFAIGDFCNGNPTLDKTDKECYQQTNLTGQLAQDCATGPMVDVKVTQTNLPLFFTLPLLSGIAPNITAQARVAAQGIGQANNLKPLGVQDAGVVPCVQVQFKPTGGVTATQTIQLAVNKNLTTSTGPIIWDNSGHNAGAGDGITIPSGANLYMKAFLYAPGASGDCSTMGSPLTYEGSNNGILYLNSYGTTLPTSTDPPKLIGNGNGGGVSLLNNTCSHDQYFSNNTGSCTVTVCAIAAFTPGSTNQELTLNGNNNSMSLSSDPNCQTNVVGASAWESNNPTTIASASGQTQFTIGWREKASGICNGNGVCSGSFGVQQQAFAACNENFNAACGGDPNISGPIIQAYITDTGSGFSTVGAFQGGTAHNLVVRLALQGLQDAPRTDRCSNGPTQCTSLRFDNNGNANGMVDCGAGNGASAARSVILFGCPLWGQSASALNPVACTNSNYCGPWKPVPVGTPDGVCNYAGRTGPIPVECINTNNNGQTMPECIQALVVSAGGNNGVVDYSQINQNNCHVNGSTCSEDKWLDGAPIIPGVTQDARIITTFIVYQGDIAGANGNHDMQIRTFASFYVTGWTFNGNPVNCTGLGANEPPPVSGIQNGIWGHWITYTEPGAGGNGQPCNFQAFGDCAVVLTR